MLFRRHSRGENSRVGQVLVAWFRDFGRASRPWLRRARRRDSWRSLRLTKVAGLHDANAKSLWNLLTRENAARIRKEDRSRSRSFSEKNFDPDPLDRRRRSMGETRGWLWKGRTGMNHPDPFVLRSGRWNAREKFRSYPFWSFENRSLWNEWNEIASFFFLLFFV